MIASQAPERRLTIDVIAPPVPAATFDAEVRAGLTAEPKRLPCRFFYDQPGSLLFEQICELPEYYLTRAEHQILAEHAGAIAATVPPGAALVELGSGSAAKTRRLVEACLRRLPGTATLRFVPIDISRDMLEASARQLLAEYPRLEVHAIAAEYHDGLRRLAHLRQSGADPHLRPDRPQLVLWLGSNVGNFERAEAATFLRHVRATMGPDDRLLLGVDLRKARDVLEPAYDDAHGVTARFNKNLLARINRELGSHFDLARFAHCAVYDVDAGRIEMYLVSLYDQAVSIDALDLCVRFAAGEAIHTENSYKYSSAEIEALAAAAGFAVERRWLDAAGQFSENLFRPLESVISSISSGAPPTEPGVAPPPASPAAE